MEAKIKIFGKLKEDKETIELYKEVCNFLQIARIEVEGEVYGLFVESTKKTLHLVKGESHGMVAPV